MLTGTVPGTGSAADFDMFRKTRGLLKAFELGTKLLVGPIRDASALFESTVMGTEIALVSPAVLRGIAARRTLVSSRS